MSDQAYRYACERFDRAVYELIQLQCEALVVAKPGLANTVAQAANDVGWAYARFKDAYVEEFET